MKKMALGLALGFWLVLLGTGFAGDRISFSADFGGAKPEQKEFSILIDGPTGGCIALYPLGSTAASGNWKGGVMGVKANKLSAELFADYREHRGVGFYYLALRVCGNNGGETLHIWAEAK